MSALLGATVSSSTPLSGGDLSEVRALDMADGRRLVAKRGGPLIAEAEMLKEIAATGCPAPEVVHVDEDVLVMTRLAERRPGTEQGHAQAGAAVARMHAATAKGYGWPRDHSFGEVVAPAGTTADWPTFWAERRLLAWPDRLPSEVAQRVEALASKLPDALPHAPPPSLLHGDLWTGNVLFDGDFSGVIDPACYHGHAEVDLAMLTVFGSPPASFWEAYGPLDAGWEERRPIYQLWPALVHLRLFGMGYRSMVDGLLDATGV